MSDFRVMPDFLAALEEELRRRATAAPYEVMPDFLPLLEQELRARAATAPPYEAMPDFLDHLERDLRGRARAAAAPQRRRVKRWRRPAFAIAFAASVLAQAMSVDTPVVHESPAFGSPLILTVRPIDAPAALRRRGLFGHLHVAPKARPIRAFGATAYVLEGGDWWCIYLPDTGVRHPGDGLASVCTHRADLFRIGLSIWRGRRYMAVLPSGVRPPVLKRADGTSKTLSPSSQGVVTVADLKPGDRIVLHGVDGRTRIDRNGGLDATLRTPNRRRHQRRG